MKKIIIISVAIIVAVVVLCIVFTLSSEKSEQLCGKYSSVDIGTGGVLDFKGESVTVSYFSSGREVFSAQGTYHISDGNIDMSFDDTNSNNIYDGLHKIEICEDYIVFDGIKYKKEN